MFAYPLAIISVSGFGTAKAALVYTTFDFQRTKGINSLPDYSISQMYLLNGLNGIIFVIRNHQPGDFASDGKLCPIPMINPGHTLVGVFGVTNPQMRREINLEQSIGE